MSVLGILSDIAGVAVGVVTANPALGMAVAGVGNAIAGASGQKSANNDAAAINTSAAHGAADTLSTGYDAARDAKLDALKKAGVLSLDQYEQAKLLIEQGQNDYVDTIIAAGEGYANDMSDGGAAYRNAMTGAGALYEGSMNAAGDQYAGAMTDISSHYGEQIKQLAAQLGVDYDTAAQVYAKGLSQNADQFSDSILKAAQAEADGLSGASDTYATQRQAGADAVKQNLDPYAQGRGTPALDYLNQMMNADPATLDPSQKILRANFLRDANARLAASGLRGAGRAGVGAVNIGDANLLAQLYSSNKANSIAAANQLSTMGQNAAGQIGNAQNQASTDIAGNRFSSTSKGLDVINSAKNTGATFKANSTATGLQAINSASNAGAQARYAAGNEAAKTDLATGQTVAGTNLDIGKTVAGTQLDIGKTTAGNDQTVTDKIAGTNLDNGKLIANRGDTANTTELNNQGNLYNAGQQIIAGGGNANADAAAGKASAQAGAITDSAAGQATAKIDNSKIDSSLGGTIAGAVTNPGVLTAIKSILPANTSPGPTLSV